MVFLAGNRGLKPTATVSHAYAVKPCLRGDARARMFLARPQYVSIVKSMNSFQPPPSYTKMPPESREASFGDIQFLETCIHWASEADVPEDFVDTVDPDKQFVQFGTNFGGDPLCWHTGEAAQDGEYAVYKLDHNCCGAERIADNFPEFMLRQLLMDVVACGAPPGKPDEFSAEQLQDLADAGLPLMEKWFPESQLAHLRELLEQAVESLRQGERNPVAPVLNYEQGTSTDSDDWHKLRAQFPCLPENTYELT